MTLNAMTESAARKKWCPLTHIAVSPSGDYYTNHLNDGCMCEASVCPAWRWVPLMADDAYKDALIKAKEKLGPKAKQGEIAKYVNDNRAEFGLPTEPFEGFCGLAGRPGNG